MLAQVNISVKGFALGVLEFGSKNGDVVLSLNGEADVLGAAGEVVAAPQEATC